ncbi:hypothetical protein RIF29_18657 [Crotalaria pallida]|uniref:RRM domain-containing protein n=1 Tax=Crotalaria pallida TaxID=3830 RepID=A0AAN9I3E6_CROPI
MANSLSSTVDDFNLEDWDIEWSREDSRCYLAAKGAPQPHYQNRCIVTGLSKDTTIEELDDLFGRAGTIVESRIMKDKKSGESDGYGFVSFEYEKCLFDVIQLLNGHTPKMMGKVCLVVVVVHTLPVAVASMRKVVMLWIYMPADGGAAADGRG